MLLQQQTYLLFGPPYTNSYPYSIFTARHHYLAMQSAVLSPVHTGDYSRRLCDSRQKRRQQSPVWTGL